jgi:hypothetical protein
MASGISAGNCGSGAASGFGSGAEATNSGSAEKSSVVLIFYELVKLAESTGLSEAMKYCEVRSS